MPPVDQESEVARRWDAIVAISAAIQPRRTRDQVDARAAELVEKVEIVERQVRDVLDPLGRLRAAVPGWLGKYTLKFHGETLLEWAASVRRRRRRAGRAGRGPFRPASGGSASRGPTARRTGMSADEEAAVRRQHWPVKNEPSRRRGRAPWRRPRARRRASSGVRASTAFLIRGEIGSVIGVSM